MKKTEIAIWILCIVLLFSFFFIYLFNPLDKEFWLGSVNVALFGSVIVLNICYTIMKKVEIRIGKRDVWTMSWCLALGGLVVYYFFI